MIKCKTVVSLDLRFASKEHVNDIRKPKENNMGDLFLILGGLTGIAVMGSLIAALQYL